MHGALLLLVVFGCIALLLGFSRWLAHRHWAAAGNVAIGVVLFLVAHTYWPAAANLRSYERLPAPSMPVAQLYCERTGARSYRVTLTRLPEGRMQVYQLEGDQWRLEAKTLLWKGSAARVGLRPKYRLERLSARHVQPQRPADQQDTPLPPPVSFALAEPDEGAADVWTQARDGQRWSDQVDAGLVYGPWRPLADGARFEVWMHHDGSTHAPQMDATAANEAAARAMR
jgi:hypothetical protein